MALSLNVCASCLFSGALCHCSALLAMSVQYWRISAVVLLYYCYYGAVTSTVLCPKWDITHATNGAKEKQEREKESIWVAESTGWVVKLHINKNDYYTLYFYMQRETCFILKD